MVYARTLALPVGGNTGAISWHSDLRAWFNAFNGAYAHIEDPQFGGEVSSSWHTACQNAVDAIEQSAVNTGTDGASHGGMILFGPRRYRFTGEVEIGGKHAIRFLGTAGKDSISGGGGYGTSIYAGTNGQRLIDCDASGGAVNHWGPMFENIDFNGVWAPTGTTLVRIQNTNHWGFRNCNFNYGADQLLVDARLDLSGAFDASYGLLEHCNFANYTGTGFKMPGGQCTAVGINFFQGGTGSWAMDIGGYVANAGFYKVKVDSTAGGIWCKSYACEYSQVGTESCSIGVKFDKDAAVSFSGHDNTFRKLNCTGHAGTEIGMQFTANLTGYNEIDGFYHQGLGTIISDSSSGKWWGKGNFDTDGIPLLKLPNRSAAPSTPVGGTYVYGLGGAAYTKGTDGVARLIGN